jgi:ribosome biogenesis GTPase
VLDELGWDAEWEALAVGRTGAPARVVRADGAAALLATEDGEVRAPGAGLVTGDWALFLPGPDPDGPGTALRLPRRTELVRGAGGKAAARQVLAANVELVFVLVSLAAPPSAGRLDRLLTVAWDSGARPVVVLTKADLAEGTAAAERDEVTETAGPAPVLLTSTVDGRGLTELRAMLSPGTTAALLGVSGAGKSSLRNALGAAPGPVAPVGRTGRGRHTTTARELVLLPGGGLLLDTPGLRGVQLWAADEGPVSARRVASHAALRHEVGWLQDRYDARQRAEQRRQWKQLSKAVRAGRKASPRHGDRPR